MTITVTPNTYDYGDVKVGENSKNIFTISTDGKDQINYIITGDGFSSDPELEEGGSSVPVVISGTQTFEFHVYAVPLEEKAYSSIITIDWESV